MQPPYTEPAAVDRGSYPDTVTPWEDPDWRATALAWAHRELAAAGRPAAGEWRVRLRPWSVLVRFTVADGGTVWFKANPPASAFEAALGQALARWVPGQVLTPLAVHTAHGWSLLPDGGDDLRTLLAREPVDPRAWEAPLTQYATLQRALVPHADAVARLGVPEARTADLTALFDRLVDADTALTPEDRARLGALRPRLAEGCAELAALGLRDTLDHADLHEGQMFRPRPGRFVFFDWGDALVTHPLCSFLVPARQAVERYGPGVLPRLRDAYLEPWTGAGPGRAELRHALRTATRLAALGRASAWGRLFPGARTGAAGPTETAASLRELLTEPWEWPA
ncbi:aminoglycoside phosphotransferase family protein [Streptomyces sp. NPDC048290]|uniref:aminoglycoside phosphotransferase family protein n=1 Tax=Streptomyces sp. NPDC048290 TaxID=3155811 RepID=UPI00342D0D3B